MTFRNMGWKNFFKPNFIKIVITIVLSAVLFFLPIFPILQPYSPKIGAEYLGPLHVFSSLYYVFFEGFWNPSLYWLTYIFISLYIGIVYLITCLLVNFIRKLRQASS